MSQLVPRTGQIWEPLLWARKSQFSNKCVKHLNYTFKCLSVRREATLSLQRPRRVGEYPEVGEVAFVSTPGAHCAVLFGGPPSPSTAERKCACLTRVMRPLDSKSAIPLAASFFSATQRIFRMPRKATSMAARDKVLPPGRCSQPSTE